MELKRIHHVAYRCKDAKETVDFYQRVLNMDFTVAFAEDQVPSTKEPDPYMHVFLDCGMGNVLAFFELPTRPEMDRDHNTPEWVQHIAFEVENYDALLAAKAHVEAEGLDVIGPTNHGIFQSIYNSDFVSEYFGRRLQKNLWSTGHAQYCCGHGIYGILVCTK